MSVYGVPELSTKTRITNTGDVYLPLVDYVHVADLNLDEAQTLIEKRLSDGGFVRNPHVTIFVNESASQGATILGEVTRPGVYPVLGERRLYEFNRRRVPTNRPGGDDYSADQTRCPVTVHLPSNLSDQTDANVAVAPGTPSSSGVPVSSTWLEMNRPSGFRIETTIDGTQGFSLGRGANRPRP